MRSLIYLAFLLLAIVLAVSYTQYVRHTLSNSVSVTFHRQKSVYISVKEQAAPLLLFKYYAADQEDDDLKA